MQAWHLFRAGIRFAARRPRAILLLYLINLGSALFLAALPGLDLLASVHFPATREALDGVDPWLVIETLLSPVNRGEMGQIRAPLFNPLAFSIILFMLPILSGFPTFALGGPMADILSPEPLNWREILRAIWRWLFSFTIFSLLVGICWLVILIICISLGWFLSQWVQASAWLMVALLLPPIYLFVQAWSDLTRLGTVRSGGRTFTRHLGPAFRVFTRNLWPIIGLEILSLLALAAVNLGLGVGLLPRLPPTWWPLVLALGQVTIALRLFVHCCRWAGLAQLRNHEEAGYPHSGA